MGGRRGGAEKISTRLHMIQVLAPLILETSTNGEYRASQKFNIYSWRSSFKLWVKIVWTGEQRGKSLWNYGITESWNYDYYDSMIP